MLNYGFHYEQEEPESMAGDKSESPIRSKEEIALELMKFISVTTGYGKGTAGAGFANKPAGNAEEYAESLLQLYDRCLSAVSK